MAAYIGEGTLMELKRQALRAKETFGKKMESIDRGVESFQSAVTVGASAFAFGLANGRVGGGGLKVPLINAPADLTFGVGLHLLTFFGNVRADRIRSYQDIANGALGSYFSTLGAQVGNAWKLRGGGFRALFAGDDENNTTGGAALADEELARMVRPA